MARVQTLRDLARTAKEQREKAAVYQTAANYLRTRYVSRDSVRATAQIPCEGAPVQEAVVSEVAEEFEAAATQLMADAEQTLNIEVE